MSRDAEFLKTYDSAVEGLDAAYAAKNTWMARRFPELQNTPIAYFSAEFAIHQSLPIYAGGLGVLAGDHCKESSDLGIPLVGVGLHVSAGVFSPDDLAGGLAARSVRTAQLARRGDRTGDQARWFGRASSPCLSAIARC